MTKENISISEQDLEFEYTFKSINEYDDGESYIKRIRLNVTATWYEHTNLLEPKIHKNKVGYAEMIYWNRTLFMETAHENPRFFCDDVSNEMLKMYECLFDDDGCIKEEYQERLGINDRHDIDICLVTRMVSYPKYRGKGLIKQIKLNISEQLGNHALIVGEPFPLQYKSKCYRQKGDKIDNYFKTKTFEQAYTKVKTSLLNNGYIELSKRCPFLAIPPFSLTKFRNTHLNFH